MSENNGTLNNLLHFENRYWTDSNGVKHKYPLNHEWDPEPTTKERIGCWTIMLAVVLFWVTVYKLFMWWLT
jgi:hypothetical protein